MNDYLLFGKVANTHGLKGEIRLLSNFSKKNLVLCPGKKIYIGYDKVPETITSYRPHKEFDMVVLDGKNYIDDVIKYKGQLVYIKRSEVTLENNDYLLEDFIGMSVFFNEKCLGLIKEISYNNANKLLLISNEEKNFYLPLNDNFIDQVLINEKKVIVKNVEGLI